MNKFAASLLFVFCAAAQNPPNLSGVWEWNKDKNTQERGPDRLRCKIEQQGSNIAFAFRADIGPRKEQQAHRVVIGQETRGEMHGAPMTSRAEWDRDTLVIRSVAVIANKELRLTQRWTLSPDGGKLTMRERRQYGAEPEAEEAHVLERRPETSWEPDAPPKPAEEVYKNIQIMKGLPAPRLTGVMNNLTRWLGVECAHCHVVGQFEKDDKPAKETARKMFGMVRAIGQEHFSGSNPVTCWTCHRGAAKPQSLPPQ